MPVLENGVIYIRDENGGDFGIINPIYVYDSFDGDPSLEKECHFTYENRFELTPISDGKYKLVVIVDEDFLNNPATVYPVIVDLSITINSTGSGSSKSILDTPIYNGSGAAGTAGVNSLAVIGYVGSSYGSGRLLMRFPGLMKQSFMNSDYTITSATLTVNECSGGSESATIRVYNYTGPAWDESTKYSSSVYNGVGDSIDYWWFSYPNEVTRSYNITSAVRSWQISPSQGAKGIIFKNTTSETDNSKTKNFYTSEGTTKPYLSVTYVRANTSFDTAKTVSAGNRVTVNISASGQKRFYSFTAPTTGYYSFESSNNGSYDPNAWLYNSGKTQIDYSDDHGGNKDFHIIQRLTGGQKYYFAVGCFGSATGTYSLHIVARTPAEHAYSHIELPSRTVSIQLIGSTTTDSTWMPLIESSKNAWNNSKAGTNISLTTTSSSSHKLKVYAYPWSALGKTDMDYYANTGIIISSTININTNTLSTSPNERRSTITHEIGHLFGLDDNPKTTDTDASLMDHTRDRETVFLPQFVDVYHVLNEYS
ncbi:MAG: hypothetical protein HDT46_02320 [Ruminococcaceae bacterium]|nr:hypothetical protein [Oscillospiraceae bacterium]